MNKKFTVAFEILLAVILQILYGFSYDLFSMDYMKLSDIKQGMTGYGLSVFKNTEPETFGVEIISILKNQDPSRDIILVKCSGQNLEKSRIIAGMSGSPIYINGKLIGALAYAWQLSLDPIAGVTPIESMLYDYNNPLKFLSQTENIKTGAANSELKYIKAPMTVSGINLKAIEKCSDFFDKFNFLPVESGGSGYWEDTVQYKPGGAISVQLITGDWTLSSIGTITAITDNGDILAFGHPMFGWGKTKLPAATAGIHTIMNNLSISWKMGSPIKENGSVVQDRYSCIVADSKIKSELIKTKIKLGYENINLFKTFNLNIVDNKSLTPYLFLISAYNSEYAFAEAAGQKLTVKQKMKIKFNEKYNLEYNNWEYNEDGGLNDMMIFFNAFRLYGNPFKEIKVEELHYESSAVEGEQKYKISEVAVSSKYCNIGDTLIIDVKLSHTVDKDVRISVPVYISEDFEDMTKASFQIASGENVPVITGTPETFEDYIENMKQKFVNNQIVIYYKTNKEKYVYRNKVLESGSASFNEKLFSDKSKLRKIPDYKYIPVNCNFIVTGNGYATIDLNANNLLKNK
ncbi:MAG TPA: SpoIVB peptidase S55 domain-containing protein [bacterium]|nr:SpoIVB peptidase S55 domain-containing protein [bacterium]